MCSEIRNVTSKKIINYQEIKIHNNINVVPNLFSSKFYWSNTLKLWQKTQSFSTVNKMANWDKVAQCGNSIHCAEVNCLIDSIVKLEG